MLGKTWRLVAVNNTGVAMAATDTVVANITRWNIGSTGARVAEATAVNLFASTAGNSLANGAYVAGNTQDNTAVGTFWFGGELDLRASVNTATPAGNVSFYYQTSSDGGTTWPDNGQGELIDSINFTAVGTQKDSVAI